MSLLPVVLCLRGSQLTDLRRLAVAVACRQVVVTTLPANVLLEHGVVGLEEGGDIVPERGSQLGCGVRISQQRAVRFFDRIQELPLGAVLVRGRAYVGVVDVDVEDAERNRVDIIDPASINMGRKGRVNKLKRGALHT